MVSPAWGMKAPAPEAMVAGKGVPPVAEPAHAGVNRFCRPCEIGRCALPGRWQPLQVTTSPGISCSHTPWAGTMRRALASSTSISNATLAGTSMRTEPSGSIGA